MIAPPPHVAAGTQVVLKCDVRGTNDSPVHPRGAVGIVARTPAGSEELYLIRFPDGFESSFSRAQFEILKHFKDRLPANDQVSDVFELESCIIYRCVVGSRAYGLETESSDTDRRGVYLAPLDMHLSLFGAPEQFEDNTEQTCYWELQKFIVMALKANPNILECLYSPLVEKSTPLAERLLALRESFLSQMVFQTFNGYALSQFKKLEQDRRNQGEVRWKHAMHRLNLQQMLLEPEMLAAAEPDVHLVATLLSLSRVIPNKTKDTARQVVRKVVEDIERQLAEPLRQAVRGALARSARNRRPRLREIDWHKTIRANLKNYQPDHQKLVVESLVGHGRKRSSVKDVILCVDQSGSMATSVVYSSIFGAVLASLPALTTKMVLFDTAVVDMTAELKDPIDLLFGAQLGGGTDIHKALTYCTGLVQRPADTTLVLITDLYEGGDAAAMLRRAAGLVASGVNVICLLALTDSGSPTYHHHHAASLSAMGVPVFACTPDRFADLMAAALSRHDLHLWAEQRGIKLERGESQS